MLHHGSKFHMKMCREPVTGLEMSQELFCRRTSQSVGLHFLSEELLLPKQFLCTSIVVDSTRPIVAHENIHRHLNLGAIDFKITLQCSNKYLHSLRDKSLQYLPVLIWIPPHYGCDKHFEVCQDCMEGIRGDLKKNKHHVKTLIILKK